jgi:hypothetical protein
VRKKLSAMEEAGWEDQERLELRLAKVEAAVGRVQEAQATAGVSLADELGLAS